jgi:hypothetical protein
VVFHDRVFSEWSAYANPSVKKLLDRTIAKVDSDLNRQEIHYGWAHFEPLEALAYSPKSVTNFHQKLIKLTELGYLPLSPDFYVRGKLRGHLGYAECEPRKVAVRENSSGADIVPDSTTFSKWRGVRSANGNGALSVVEHQKFVRRTRDGLVEEEGPQCWKLAWDRTSEVCSKAVIGDLETCKGGLAEVLANLTGSKNAELRSKNVSDFLSAYTYVFWREHFIQHELSEADINIHEIANETLRAGVRGKLDERQASIAGAAAQSIFLAFDSKRSCATSFENMDQRAVYQNVVMLTVSLCNAVYIHHWLKDTKKARKFVDLIKTELMGFQKAFDRYRLSRLGVTRKCWEAATQSHVDESSDNIVVRAATRVAATHLRPLGYRREFSRDDELLTVNVGHIWSAEIDNLNYRYENPFFCGVREA